MALLQRVLRCALFCWYRLIKYGIAVYCSYMQTIVETPEFIRCTKALKIPSDELQEIIGFLAKNPTAGNEIPGTGGARKLRFARPGSGKSGGYRVITFYSGESIPLFLLSMFAKNQKVNLSQSEKNTLKRVLSQLVDYYENSEVS